MNAVIEWIGLCLEWAFARWSTGTKVLNLVNYLLIVLGLSVGIFVNPTTAAIIFLIMFVLVILVAPYKLWKAEHDRAENLNHRLKPRIGVEPHVVKRNGERIACVNVRGLNDTRLEGCIGELTSIRASRNGHEERVPMALGNCRWSIRYQDPNVRLSPKIDIGNSADLNIATLPVEYNGRVMIELIDGKRPVEEANFFIFGVDISAKETAKKRCHFKLTIEPLGRRCSRDPAGGVIPPNLPKVTFTVIER